MYNSFGFTKWFPLVAGLLAGTFVCSAQVRINTRKQLMGATAGQNYTNTLTASGGTAPYTFAVSSGQLPPGITLSSSGTLSGTSNSTGAYQFNIQVNDAASATATKQFNMNVLPSPLTIQGSSPLPSAVVGQDYSNTPTFIATGGTNIVCSFGQGSTSLPPGLQIDDACDGLFGTPSTPGTYNFIIKAYDADYRTATLPLTLTVLPAQPLTVLANNFGAYTFGNDVLFQLGATGGYVPYTWSTSPTALPPNLTLSPSGVIEGAIANAGNFSIPVTVTDAKGNAASGTATFTANSLAPGNLQITTTQLPAGVVGQTYSKQLIVSGEYNSGVFWSITGGTLPQGFTLDSASGVLHSSNVPGPPGNYTVQIQAFNGGGESQATATKTLSLDTYSSPLTISLGTPSTTITLQGGAEKWFPITSPGFSGQSVYYDVVSGSLPPGLSIVYFGDPTVAVDGTAPDVTQTYTATIRGQTADGLVGTQTFTFKVVASGTPPLTGATLPSMVVGTYHGPTDEDIANTGDFLMPLLYTTAGPLPPGISLDSLDNIFTNVGVAAFTGTPTTPGTYTFTVTRTDAAANKSSASYTINVLANSGTLSFTTPSPLPEAFIGTPYSGAQLTLSGGTSPYTFSALSGALPPGFSLSSAGAITSANPVTGPASGYIFAVTATDSTSDLNGGPVSVKKNYELDVSNPLTVSSTKLAPATSGAAYNYTIPVSGGIMPYTFTVVDTAQQLPAGLTLNSATGTITGSTTQTGNYTIGISITDADGSQIIPAFSLAVTAPLTVTNTSLPTADVLSTAPYNVQVNATGGVPPYTYYATGLPPGLSINSGGGITGVCQNVGSYTVHLNLTDSAQNSYLGGPLTLACNPAPSITTSSVPNGMTNVPYSVTFATNAIYSPPGAAPYTWSLSGSNLPASFSLNSSTGTLSGTPTTSGTYQFTVQFKDAWGAVATAPYTLKVNATTPLTLTSTSPLPAAYNGTPYSYQLTYAGGQGPFTFSATGLPAWLSLNSATGLLTGNPPTGTSTPQFSVTITDSESPAATNTQTYQLPINPLTITTGSSLPAATADSAYNFTFTATGGTPAYTWSSPNLPSFLTLDPTTGLLHGTPADANLGAYSFLVTVKDSANHTASSTVALNVNPGALVLLSTSPLPAATPGVPYSFTFTAQGGFPPYFFQSSTLPSWLTLNGNTGVLSGTPPSAGPVTFSISVSDDGENVASGNFTLPVNAALTIGTPATLPPATVNKAYTATLTASGGTGGYMWTATGLPSWLQLSSTGVLSDTPTTAGPVSFTANLTDSSNTVASRMFNLTVNAALTITNANPLPPATVSTVYMQTFTASGGSGGYIWSATGLPSYLSLSSTGVLMGTPPTAGPVTFTVTATDSSNNTTSVLYTLPVNAAISIQSPSTLPTGQAGVPYSYNFTASGGTGTYTWSGVQLPSWLSITSAGYLSGTPPTSGPVTFSIVVTDTANDHIEESFTLPVNPALLITNTSPLPAGVLGAPYSLQFAATGGTGGYTWSGSGLPTWLSITSAGLLTGTPPVTGISTFSITVADSSNEMTTVMYTLPVFEPLLITTAATLPSGTVGSLYSLQLTATGGSGTYLWTATGLPTWLSLSSTGLLTGTPPSATPVTFTAILDGTVMKTLTLPVTAGLNILTTSPLPAATVGSPYSTVFTAAGGAGGYTWTPTGLPTWLSLTPTGTLTGTPPAGVPAPSFTVTVTDVTGLAISRMFTLPLNAALTITNSSPLPAATVGTPVSIPFTATGGTGGYLWSISGQPSWLSISSTGLLTGTPPTAGDVTFVVNLVDSSSNTLSRSFTLPVNSALMITTTTPLSPATVGAPYSLQLGATGGSGSYLWTGSKLPSWLTLSSTGLLTGTPPAAGMATFTVTVNGTVSANLTLPINAMLTIGTTSPLAPATVGMPYSLQLAASGGSVIYTWTATGLPTWLTLSSTGLLSGTPPSAGPVTFSATVNNSVTANFTLPVNAALTIGTTSPLAPATVGTPYSLQLTASGGSGIYTWTATGLPEWLSLSSTGLLLGTPPTASPVTFSVTVNGLVSANLTLPVNSALTIGVTSPLSPATVGVPYSLQLTASGGSGVYTWSATGLPDWLMLSSTGLLAGIPPTAGPVTFTVTVNGLSANLTLPVNAALVIGTASPLPPATVGAPYSLQLAASGGTGTYTWSPSSLPDWLTLTSAGLLTGTPTTAGPVMFSATVNGVVTASFTLPVNAALTIGTTSPLPAATVGVPYTFQFAASGGTGTYIWSGTKLPDWLTLTSTGLLTGTPPTPGSIEFDVTVNGAAGAIFTLPINAAVTIGTTSPLPPATVGVPYMQQLTASGGSGLYNWTATGLPDWLTLTSAGLLTGTPPTAGPVTFTATVNGIASASFTLPVNAPLAITTTSPLSPATVGSPYSLQLTASGGTGIYTWTGAGLPDWLTLSSTGLLSGTPPSPTSMTFTVTVDGAVSASLTLPVNAALAVPSTLLLNPATVAVPYSAQLTASGGTGTFLWTATGLPSWLTLSSTGLLTGTPPTPGTVTFTATVNRTASTNVTVPVNAALTITTTTPLSPATQGTPYSLQFAATGGSGTYSWTATSLPTWLTLSSTGLLTGTPPTVGPVTFSATVNGTTSGAFTLPVNAPLTITTTTPLSPATVGTPYSLQFAATGGSGTYTWTTTGLPAWLTLSSTGLLTGTPPTSGPVTFSATVNASTTARFTLPVNAALTITTTSPLPSATVNAPYSQQLNASGGSGTYTWTATGLPSWLILTPAGLLTGKPPSPGVASFTATVNGSVTATYTLVINSALTITTVSPLPAATAGTPYSFQLGATGGATGTYSWSGSGLPGWLTLTATGLLTGTPPTSGSVSFTATVNSLASANFTLPINPGSGTQTTLTINPAILPNGTVNAPYSVMLQLLGATGSTTWSLTQGNLPPGLTLDPTSGTISGQPTSAGTYPFTVQAVNGSSTIPGSLSIVVAPPAGLTITSPSQLPTATLSTAYTFTLQATGGTAPYTWSLSGTVPAGLTLNSSTGVLSGTPTAAGIFPFSAVVHDSSSGQANKQFTLIVASQATPVITSFTPLPDGIVGQTYQTGLTATGGTPPYIWSIAQGSIPPGLTFDPTSGLFTGTPTQTGTYQFTAVVTDSATPQGATATQANSIRITDANGFQITSLTLPNAAVNTPYSSNLQTTGGTPPVTWQLANGILPSGISFSSNGLLSGTPTASGAFPFTVQAFDTASDTATAALNLLVTSPNTPAITATPAPPSGTVGAAYSATLAATGGDPPYSWSVSNGSLPPGLSLSSSGSLSGTPTQQGAFPFTVLITDSNQATATANFTIGVFNNTLTINAPDPLPSAAAGVPYSYQLSATGGAPPYNWSLTTGGLLSGISINAQTGLIQGTPTQTGALHFTVLATDTTLDRGTQGLDLSVAATQLTINPGPTTLTLPAGSSFTQTLTASQGTPPYTWSVISGTLPPGITLNPATGILSGSPTTPGTYPFTIRTTDSNGNVADQPLTAVVQPAMVSIATTTLPPGTAGAAYSQPLQVSGGIGTINWTSTGLPAGLTIDSATGAISGTPTVAGSFPVSVQATDSAGNKAALTYTLTIAAPPVPSIRISGVNSTSNPGDKDSVNIDLASAYGFPITATATVQITPDLGGSTDLAFSNGSRTIQITIPQGSTHASIPLNIGTVAGTIQLTLSLQALGVSVTPSPAPSITTQINPGPPVLTAVSVAQTTGGFTVKVTGNSTTRDMKTATFNFTPTGKGTLQTSTVSVDVSAIFAQWFSNPQSYATGSQFSLDIPFSVGGQESSIAAVSVTLTNSVGTSGSVSANVQ